jgi:hypothetical protein
MEREPGRPAALPEYRVVASANAGHVERKLQAARAEGFRIAVVLEPLDQWVFVLHRTADASERFDYQFARLKEEASMKYCCMLWRRGTKW